MSPFNIFFSLLSYVSVIMGNKNDLPLEPWHAIGKTKIKRKGPASLKCLVYKLWVLFSLRIRTSSCLAQRLLFAATWSGWNGFRFQLFLHSPCRVVVGVGMDRAGSSGSA